VFAMLLIFAEGQVTLLPARNSIRSVARLLRGERVVERIA
jgi:hypothetical protein